MPAAIVVAHSTRLAFTKRTLVQASRVATCLNCAALVGLLTASATRDAALVFPRRLDAARRIARLRRL